MASRSKQTEIHPSLKLQGVVAVEAEFVHYYKYFVVDLQIIMCIRRHVTLVYPIQGVSKLDRQTLGLDR